MSSEQIPQNNTPPVEKTETSTETVTETTQTPETKTEFSFNNNNNTNIKSWKDSISEEYRNDPNIAKFTEIDALAKSYINATK